VLLVADTAATPTPTYVVLQGPAGKMDLRLTTTKDPKPVGVGSSIWHDAWRIDKSSGRALLRYGDNRGCVGHWVAVKRTDGRWEAWWIEINAANMGDLAGYVLIDLLPVEVTS
jgi:hypothetical protein